MCVPDFGKFLESELENISTLSTQRKEILQQYGLHLIGDKFPSMNRSAQASLGKFNNKNVIQALKDFERGQNSLKERRLSLLKSLDKRRPIKIIGDDYVIEKVGKDIDGTSYQFDHVQNKTVNSFLLVDIAIKQGDMLYTIIFAQREPTAKKSKDNKVKENSENHSRQLLIKNLIKQLRKELKIAGFSNKKITVILDRWYPTEGLFKFLRVLKVNFVVGVKKSTQVLLPDKKKYLRSLIRRRGRPLSDFTITMRIEEYMEKYQNTHSFYDSEKETTILYKSVQINLNIAKQVMVYAFMYENQHDWRYFITNVFLKKAKKVYDLHKERWPIETAHYDAKQIFGIKEGHMRKEQHVQAHLKYVYFLYQTYLKYKIIINKHFKFKITSRQLFDHVSHIITKVPDPLQAILSD